MKYFFLSFLFFIFCISSSQGFIPPSLSERDEACKKALKAAAFSDITYKQKIKTYDSLLPLLSFGVSHAVEKKYMSGLKKIFLTRNENSFENNKILEQLFLKVKSIPSFKKEHETLDSWIMALNENNSAFALTSNSIIALYLPELKGYFRPQLKDQKIVPIAGPFDKETYQPHPSILFSITNSDKTNDPIQSHKEYLLTPLYYQKETEALTSSELPSFKITFKKKNALQTNVYDKELVQIAFSDTSILHQNKSPLWAKIEKIDHESLYNIENEHFAHQIKKMKIVGSTKDLIKQIQSQLLLFNDRISTKNKEMVMNELRQLIEKKERLDPSILQCLRNTCAQAVSFLPSGPEKKECKRWISEINQTIEKTALCFDDIIILHNTPEQRVFTRFNPHSKTEPLALGYTDPTKQMHALGTELIKISSPSRKTGIIRYGDDITLTPLYASQNGKITRLTQTDGFARRQKECRGSHFHYLGCAPITLSQAPQKTTFTLLPPPELASLKKIGACCTDNDSFLLLHQASQAFISFNEDKNQLQPYLFSEKGSPFFIQKAPEALLNQVHASLIKKELLASNNSTTYQEKIAHLQKIITSYNNPLDEKTSNALWTELESLFHQIKSMNKDETTKYVHALLKLTPLLTSIDEAKKKQLLVHACFHQKIQVAESKSGAARLACYHELIPFLKKYAIDPEYKTALLEKIQNLHERKTTEFSSLEKLLELAKNE